jgi:SPP1 gp7 family putative phage head morphogenesis protein
MEQLTQKWPEAFSIEHFYQRLEDLTTQELIGPAAAILAKEIPDAFTHGTKYADLNLKAKMGIKLGAPLEERQRAWQKVGALVEKSKGEFKGVSDAVNQQIRRAVADGMVNEDSLSTVTKSIQDVTADIGEVRARMIARTETMKAINTGAIERYSKIGIDKVEWLAAEDERVCDRDLGFPGGENGCGGLDGQIFDIDKAPPCPAHIFCRCTLIPYVDTGDEEEGATQKQPHTHCTCGHEQITGGQGRFL